MRTYKKVRGRWGRLLPLLALLLAPFLAACTEDLIKAVNGDPTPSENPTEITLVTAEFDQDAGRMAIPNDLILVAVQEVDPTLLGTVKTMPIRIPFTGAIDYPYAPGNSPTADEIAAFAASIFFFDTLGVETTRDARTEANGGFFKTIYQDANNDLVLVPNASAFAIATTYAAVVTKGITDTNGNTIGESVPMFLVKSDDPLLNTDGESVSSLVDDEQAATLEQIRQGFAPLFAGLEAGFGQAREDISLMFTFTVEPVDSLINAAALIGGMEAQATSAVAAMALDLFWFNGASFVSDVASAVDVQSTFSDAGAPVDNLDAVYTGYYSCLNFLDSDGSGDFEIDATVMPETTTCPNTTGLTGNIEFLLAKPAATTGTVVFLHGITRDKTDVAAIANTLASVGLATVAIDIWGHGTRTVSIAGTEVEFIRPDDPAKTVGYMYQTRSDIQRLEAIVAINIEFQSAAGNSGPVYFVGQSLGSIIGSLAMSSGTTTFTRAVLNVAGADLVDIVLRGDIGDEVIAGVSAVTGEAVGSDELNATLLGIELATRHALFAGLVDPLAVYDGSGETLPANVLVQEITGDGVIANDATELLSRMMDLTEYGDGDGAQTDLRVRWTYNPGNYSTDSAGDPAGHGFLLDGETDATDAGQAQVVNFLLGAGVVDPSQ